jgi:hypothetical protein
MTTPASDDRVAPKDPRFDAAWRAASNEEPPAALDAAILAAARREAGAGPRSARAQMAMDTRRRWWPLAAAATVAAVAVGVLELVTPDQLSAPSLDSTTVTDMPTREAKPAPNAVPPAAREEAAKPSASNSAASARGAFGAAQQENSAAGDATRPIGGPRQEASGARPTPREDVAKASASAQRPAPRIESQRPAPPIEAQRPAPSIEAQRIPSPFPAAPATSQPSADAISQPSAAANVQPSARASEATSVPEVPSASARARAAAAPAPMAAPAPPAPAPAMAGAVSERPTPLAKTLAGSAQADQAAEARIKDRPTLSVADWIALIRRLRAEGKTTEAAKELAAFRTAHADHEKLLPPDLRDWHPPTQ